MGLLVVLSDMPTNELENRFDHTITRRQFLKTAAAAAIATVSVPSVPGFLKRVQAQAQLDQSPFLHAIIPSEPVLAPSPESNTSLNNVWNTVPEISGTVAP